MSQDFKDLLDSVLSNIIIMCESIPDSFTPKDFFLQYKDAKKEILIILEDELIQDKFQQVFCPRVRALEPSIIRFWNCLGEFVNPRIALKFLDSIYFVNDSYKNLKGIIPGTDKENAYLKKIYKAINTHDSLKHLFNYSECLKMGYGETNISYLFRCINDDDIETFKSTFTPEDVTSHIEIAECILVTEAKSILRYLLAQKSIVDRLSQEGFRFGQSLLEMTYSFNSIESFQTLLEFRPKLFNGISQIDIIYRMIKNKDSPWLEQLIKNSYPLQFTLKDGISENKGLLSIAFNTYDQSTIHFVLSSITSTQFAKGYSIKDTSLRDSDIIIGSLNPSSYESIVAIHTYIPVEAFAMSSKVPMVFFAGSPMLIGFYLAIHDENFITYEIDLKDWLKVYDMAYSKEPSSTYRPKNIIELIMASTSPKKYNRTVNLLQFQYLVGNEENIEYIVQHFLPADFKDVNKFTREEMLVLFQLHVVKKHELKAAEALKAEADLLRQEEKQKQNRQKKKNKNKQKQKQQQQNNKSIKVSPSKQQSQQQTNINIDNIIQQKDNEKENPQEKQDSVIIKENVIENIATTTNTTPNTNIQSITELKNSYDICIGKFKFNRKDDNLLGRGSNGTLVYKGLWNDKIPVAIKQMHKAFNPMISKEIEILIKFTDSNCRNIVRYIDQEEDDMFVYLGLTLCERSLQDMIDSNQPLFSIIPIPPNHDTQESLINLIIDMINGVKFLHDKGIVHNDLNPRNILLKDGRFLIADLGLSKMEVTSSFSFTMHSPTGQEGYHPAEVLLEKRKTKSVDIFSLGCIIYLFISSKHPFGDKLLRVANILTDQVKIDPIITTSHPVLCNLISSMISKDQDKRPTIDNVLAHPAFWNSKKRFQFIESVFTLFRDNSVVQNLKSNFLNTLVDEKGVKRSFLSKPWNKSLDSELIEVITSKSNTLNNSNGAINGSPNNSEKYFYNYDSLHHLIRCIRNTIQHHQEIRQSLKQQQQSNSNSTINSIIEYLSTKDTTFKYFESKFPDLSFYLFEKLKVPEFSNTIHLKEYYHL